MGFQDDHNENDYEFTCPDCGSSNVIVHKNSLGSYSIGKCKKCGFKDESV